MAMPRDFAAKIATKAPADTEAASTVAVLSCVRGFLPAEQEMNHYLNSLPQQAQREAESLETYASQSKEVCELPSSAFLCFLGSAIDFYHDQSEKAYPAVLACLERLHLLLLLQADLHLHNLQDKIIKLIMPPKI